MQMVSQILHGILPFPEAAYSPGSPDFNKGADDIPSLRSNSLPPELGQAWDGSAVAIWGFGHSPPTVLTGYDVKEIACGCYHTAMLTKDGSVYTWGKKAEYGMLGYDVNEADGEEETKPRKISELDGKHIAHISSAGTYMAAVDDFGVVYTWGTAVHGQHGCLTRVSTTPSPVAALKGVTIRQIACGRYHVAAVSDHDVYTWGGNTYGQLGIGSVNESEPTPQRLQFRWDGTPFQVSVGWSHTAVVTSNGRLYTFGSSKCGALGHGSTETRAVPTVVKSLMDKNICQVACGGSVTTALTDTGVVYVCGEAQYGQLGLGPQHTANVFTPVRIEALSHARVMSIASGWGHSAAIDEHGRVWVWGYNCHQQVSADAQQTHSTPMVLFSPAHAGSGVVSHAFTHLVACGYYHTAVFTASHAAPPTASAAWRLAAASSSMTALEHKERALQLSKMAGAFAVAAQRLGEQASELRISNEQFTAETKKLLHDNKLLREKLEFQAELLHHARIRTALLELQLARVIMALPPASPFGSDRLDRSSADLTRLSPPSAQPQGLRVKFVFAGRLLWLALRKVGSRMRRAVLAVVSPPQVRDPHALWLQSQPPMPLPHYAPRGAAVVLPSEERPDKRAGRWWRRPAGKENQQLVIGWKRHRTNGLRDVLVPRVAAAAIAANSGWALSRLQADALLSLMQHDDLLASVRALLQSTLQAPPTPRAALANSADTQPGSAPPTPAAADRVPAEDASVLTPDTWSRLRLESSGVHV